jgi:hypothetical protein
MKLSDKCRIESVASLPDVSARAYVDTITSAAINARKKRHSIAIHLSSSA